MLATSTPIPERDRWFVGTWLRIVADRADTGGALTVMEQRARRHFSPPLHVHDGEDTALLVLAGELRVRIGDDVRHLGPGGFAWLPRRVPHSFLVESEEAHFLELATPGGVEDFHVAASDSAGEATLPPPAEPDIPRLAGAAAAFGIALLGPPLEG